MKTLNMLLLAFALGAIAAGAWVTIDLYRYARQPAGPDDTPVIVDISPGENLDSVASRLEQKTLIRNAPRFKLLARIRGYDKRLKAGEYRLAAVMPPRDILEALVSGKVYLHRLTIPEGYTLRQVAMEVARDHLCDEDQFMALATDGALARDLGVPAPTLEGYLFPDTYYFPRGLSCQAIMAKMVQRFQEQISEAWRERARELELTLHQVVILASIIEKETGDPSERPLISSVFHNRLKKKMRLQSDPTVIYGIQNFDGNLTRKHLTTPTPYNTYMFRGLPKGPIANPGRLAIAAALYPSQTDYLYFVAKKDGTHQFSTNIEDHNQAVRKYQLHRGGAGGTPDHGPQRSFPTATGGPALDGRLQRHAP